MQSTSKEEWREFGHIVVDDLYRVRDWPTGSFDTIFDIGANIGIFSVFMRMLHPNTTIVAVEPAKGIQECLQNNTNMLNINIENKALGSGCELFFGCREGGNTLKSLFLEEEKKNSYSVDSITLPSLFNKYNSESYMVKFDCEGGEKYLIGDSESERILYNAKQVSMEIHFDSPKTNKYGWPSFNDYNDWINSVFTSHTIDYYKSRGRYGYGHYCIRKVG